MTTFRLTIECDNDAFSDSPFGGELGAILAKLALRAATLTGHDATGAVADTNGNRVGEWSLGKSGFGDGRAILAAWFESTSAAGQTGSMRPVYEAAKKFLQATA